MKSISRNLSGSCTDIMSMVTRFTCIFFSSLGSSMGHVDRLLRCSHCNRVGGIEFHPHLWNIRRVTCRLCEKPLPVREGIPNFTALDGPKDKASSVFQKLNSSRLFALLYESPLWRPLLTRVGAGISYDKELQDLLRMSKARPVQAAADLACGTGHYARAFATRMRQAQVYALDISLGMLIQARKMAKRKGLKTIIFLRGDMYHLPFDDDRLDHVNCTGALHLFPDVTPILREISRVTKPGGAFTGMTLTFLPGAFHRKMRQLMISRGRINFFRPEILAANLDSAGFSRFEFIQHRVLLLFHALKDHPVRSVR